MKFVSPNKLRTLVVDKSGRRDIIELQSGKRVGKSGSDGQEKREEEINFHWMRGVSALAQKNRLWQDEKFSDNPDLYHEA
jgi:hypothetical protein